MHSVLSNSAIPRSVAHQAPLSMEFSRQEYWSGSPFPSPGDLPNPGFEPVSLASPSLAGGFFTSWATMKAQVEEMYLYYLLQVNYNKEPKNI